MKLYMMGILAAVLLWIPSAVQAANSEQELEQAAVVELGVPFEIVSGAEQSFIEQDALQYFAPFAQESFALESAELVLEELRKYIPERLKEMNLSVQVVESKNNTVIGLASMRSVSYDGGNTYQYSCKLYVSNSKSYTEHTIREILHHEVFHCYDFMLKYEKKAKTQSWAEDFTISDYVRKAWAAVDQGTITVDYASEERAEYFSAAILQEYTKFNGQRFLIQKDAQMSEKIARMQEDVLYLMKTPVIVEEPKFKWERIWENGRIKQMMLWLGTELQEEWTFQYETNTVILEKKQTLTTYPLS